MALAVGICGAVGAITDIRVGFAAFILFLLYLAYSSPTLVILLTLLLSPFANDIPVGLPVKVAASDLCLIISFPFVVVRHRRALLRALRGPYFIPVFLYLTICIFSSVSASSKREALVSIAQMVVYLVFTVIMFAVSIPDPRIMLKQLYVVGVTSCLIAISVATVGTNYVLGLHKNSIGATLAAASMITLGLLLFEARERRATLPTQWLLFALLSGLILSLSRGAWIGALAGCTVLIVMSGRSGLAIRLLIGCLPVVIVAWLTLPEQQREYATDLSASAHNIRARLDMIDYAIARFQESPMFGVGVGLRKTYDATNVALATLAETGIIGSLCFALIFVTIGAMTVSASRRLDRDDPAYALLSIGAALVLAKLVHGMVDHYWGRGAILFWAGAGFVILGYTSSQRSRRQRYVGIDASVGQAG